MFDWVCKYTPGFLLTSKYFNTFQGLETHIANSSKESQTTWLSICKFLSNLDVLVNLVYF